MDKKLLEKRKKIIYELMCSEFYVPMKIKELAAFLDVSRSERRELEEALEGLLEDGKIEVSKRGKYAKSRGKVISGTFTGNARGFGFVTVEGQEQDVFIPESCVNGAMHGDVVQIALLPGKPGAGRRQEGKVVKVLEHGTTRVVGYFQKNKNFGFVVPDDMKLGQDVFIPLEYANGAVEGHKVVAEITDYGDERRKPEGKVVEIIGHVNDPGTDIMSIVKGYDLPVEFPEKVLRQAQNVGKPVSEADMAGRMDVREWRMVTIDGEDAKDLDDAITLEKEGENYRLGVHIADVTNYVQERSALDVEALKRGTSVYLVDRVIPMLPHILSNGICSLNAGEDRLALSCIMLIDPKGEVIDHKIAETVVRVDARMTYTSVRKILKDRDEAEMETYREFVPMFERMEELAAILRRKRRKRGSIDFDFPETKIILDKNGRPLEIKPYERNVATRIIEDFMLIANETVAQDFFWQEIPFVYRTHDTPDPEKIRKLSLFIHNFGHTLRVGQDEIHPKELQKLLEKIEDTPEEPLISRLTLRSMKQAKYTVDCTGHFGLAAKYYCHFTSPIRRYPDLQIHRIIKETLRGKMTDKRIEHYSQILPEVAASSSERERRAEEAERETDKLKKVEYMEERIGQTFEGTISSVTSWGMYVELPNTVEGLIHVTNLRGDYYHYDEASYEMVGETTGKRYKLGQTVRVTVADTDKMMRTIDFVLAEDAQDFGLDVPAEDVGRYRDGSF